jgi:hypothetical protein
MSSSSSSSSTSSSKKHVYVAIPIDVMLREHLPLTTEPSSSWQHHPERQPPSAAAGPGASHPFAYFAVGSLLGILFSAAGFWIQEAFRFANIFWYSLAWSCLTSVASYAIFYGWTVCCPSSSSSVAAAAESAAGPTSSRSTTVKSEYHFALGVFLGFCLACIVTDVLLRMPLKSILMTVAIAVAWAGVMAYCGTLEDDDGVDEEGEDAIEDGRVARPTAALLQGERKGTVLPLVIV